MPAEMEPSPYVKGAEFGLILTDYNKDEPRHHRIRVKVIETHDPFLSVPMKVAIIDTECNKYTQRLPAYAFLKLFDRRFIKRFEPENTWNPQREGIAQEIHQIINPKLMDVSDIVKTAGSPSTDRADILDEDGFSPDVFPDFCEDDYLNEIAMCEEKHKPAVKVWEEEMKKRAFFLYSFDSECRAYRRLVDLQGVKIPKFYGATMFDETSISEFCLGIDRNIPGILIEFLDGKVLADMSQEERFQYGYDMSFKSGTITCDEMPSHYQCTDYAHVIAKRISDDMIDRGVLHGDLSADNIMVMKDGRIFVIDLAFVFFRGSETPEEKWRTFCGEAGL
jgi:hypothetical protein